MRREVIGTEGIEIAVQTAAGVSIGGQKFKLDTDGTKALDFKGTGKLIVVDETNNDSAVYNVHLANDVIVVDKAYGSANLTDTLDNASTVNVYVATGKITVQSKLAAEADIKVSAYI